RADEKGGQREQKRPQALHDKVRVKVKMPALCERKGHRPPFDLALSPSLSLGVVFRAGRDNDPSAMSAPSPSYEQSTDAELAAAAKRGVWPAFAELVRRHQLS